MTATLQCAGNRRAGADGRPRHPGRGAVGAGRDRHRDVGAASRSPTCSRSPGRSADAAHVASDGADRAPEAKPAAARSAARSRSQGAAGAEVLLAWEMNGEPLPPVARRAAARRGARLHRRAQRQVARADRAARRAVGRLLPGTSPTGCCPRTARPGPGVGIAARRCRPQRRRARRPPTARRCPPGRSRCAATRSPAGTARRPRRRLARRRRDVVAGRAARGPRPVGVAPLADRRSTLPPGEHEIVVRAWDSVGGDPARGPRPRCGTRRATSTTPARGSGFACARLTTERPVGSRFGRFRRSARKRMIELTEQHEVQEGGVVVARQPIFDDGWDVVAYELLYRPLADGRRTRRAGGHDRRRARDRVLRGRARPAGRRPPRAHQRDARLPARRPPAPAGAASAP